MQNLAESCSRELRSRLIYLCCIQNVFCLFSFFFPLQLILTLSKMFFSVFWFAIRALELLSGGAKFVRIWVHVLLTINDCCISCFPFKFHDPATDASLGKKYKACLTMICTPGIRKDIYFIMPENFNCRLEWALQFSALERHWYLEISLIV